MRADGNQGESGTLDQVHCGDCAKQTSHYHELALALSALLAISLAHVGSTHLPWKATHWKVMERHLRRLSSQEYLLARSTSVLARSRTVARSCIPGEGLRFAWCGIAIRSLVQS